MPSSGNYKKEDNKENQIKICILSKVFLYILYVD